MWAVFLLPSFSEAPHVITPLWIMTPNIYASCSLPCLRLHLGAGVSETEQPPVQTRNIQVHQSRTPNKQKPHGTPIIPHTAPIPLAELLKLEAPTPRIKPRILLSSGCKYCRPPQCPEDIGTVGLAQIRRLSLGCRLECPECKTPKP